MQNSVDNLTALTFDKVILKVEPGTKKEEGNEIIRAEIVLLSFKLNFRIIDLDSSGKLVKFVSMAYISCMDRSNNLYFYLQ